MTIVVSGSAARDYIMNVHDEFTNHIAADVVHKLNLSFRINEVHSHAWWAADNICYTLGLLGESALCFSSVGDDFNIRDERSVITNYSYLRYSSELKTPSAYIITDMKNNQITWFYPGAVQEATSMSLYSIKEALTYCIIAPNEKDAMLKHLAEATELGITTFFDPWQQTWQFSAEELLQALHQATFLLFNDYECELFCQNAGVARSELHTQVAGYVVTQGAEGVLFVDDTWKELHVPAVPTMNVVDPTGAGDARRAGFVRSMKQGSDREQAMKIGNVCAHYCIQFHGTQRHTFTVEEVMKKVEEIYK